MLLDPDALAALRRRFAGGQLNHVPTPYGGSIAGYGHGPQHDFYQPPPPADPGSGGPAPSPAAFEMTEGQRELLGSKWMAERLQGSMTPRGSADATFLKDYAAHLLRNPSLIGSAPEYSVDALMTAMRFAGGSRGGSGPGIGGNER